MIEALQIHLFFSYPNQHFQCRRRSWHLLLAHQKFIPRSYGLTWPEYSIRRGRNWAPPPREHPPYSPALSALWCPQWMDSMGWYWESATSLSVLLHVWLSPIVVPWTESLQYSFCRYFLYIITSMSRWHLGRQLHTGLAGTICGSRFSAVAPFRARYEIYRYKIIIHIRARVVLPRI